MRIKSKFQEWMNKDMVRIFESNLITPFAGSILVIVQVF